MDVTPAKVPRVEHDLEIVNNLVGIAQNSDEIERDHEHRETEKNNVVGPTGTEENCETILGMRHYGIETCTVNSSAVGTCDSNEDLLITSKKTCTRYPNKSS